MERQPALAAYRSSLAAAEKAKETVDNVRLPDFVVKELPYRREQAALGVSIQAAGLDLAEHETIYAVTRMYLTVVYAREQNRVAQTVVDNVKATLETARRLVKSGSRDITTATVDKLEVILGLAQTRQIQAEEGIERATAALKEAIGLGLECSLQVAGDRLPESSFHLNRKEIIDLALKRRGELVQAGSAAEVTNLEVDAQGTSHGVKKATFAAMADIHARPIPQGMSNTEYRPGAVSLEMPTTLVGPRSARIEIARILSSRAAAVVEKTRNLIALETEDAFLKWQEAARKVPLTRTAAAKAEKLADDMRKDFGGAQSVKADELIFNLIMAGQAQAQHNETLFQQDIALAALERVTAGGFCAGFARPTPHASRPTPTVPPTNNGGTKPQNGRSFSSLTLSPIEDRDP
jgi:outer membrane protein TolC